MLAKGGKKEGCRIKSNKERVIFPLTFPLKFFTATTIYRSHLLILLNGEFISTFFFFQRVNTPL